MKTVTRICCIIILIHALASAALAGDTLIVGVAPHTSARVILDMYQPLRQHLEKSLGCSVDVVTATDFTEFARRAMKGEYDLAVTTGHQARLFQTDAGYLPMLTYMADFRSVVLVAANSPFSRPSDLNGKQVLGLSPSSLVTLWGQHWLQDNRVKPASLKYVSASDSVAQLVAAGDAEAGFTSLANFQKLPSDLRGKLRLLAESPSMAGRVYVLNKRRAADLKKIDEALWSFAASPEGKKYFEANQLGGYRKLKPKELNSMDRYAAEVRKVLQGTSK